MEQNSTRSGAFATLSIPEAYDTYLAPQLFVPWASRLVDVAGLNPGQTVLDVASGTGVAARAAATQAGEMGRVTASDISPTMLARVGDGIVTVECPAERLAIPDSSQDVVLCQQGLQFFRDRQAALAEMHRVLRPGGRIAVSVWAAEHPLGLFGPMVMAVRDLMSPPIPSAYDLSSYAMSIAILESALERAGFRDIDVETVSLTARWKNLKDVLNTIFGSLFGPPFAALPAEHQEQARHTFACELGAAGHDGEFRVDTYANVGTAVK